MVERANLIASVVGAVVGALATITVASFVLGGEWSKWVEVKDAFDNGSFGGSDASSQALDAYYVDSGTYLSGGQLCRAGYTYIGPNDASRHGGFCVGLIDE